MDQTKHGKGIHNSPGVGGRPDSSQQQPVSRPDGSLHTTENPGRPQ